MAQRCADSQAPAWHALVGNGFFHFEHVGQHPPCTTQVRFALGREGDRPGGAQQQAGAQALFGAREDAAHRRRRQAQRPGGGGQAALLGHLGKYFHLSGSSTEVHLCLFSKGGSQKCSLVRLKFGS
ncbi:hypothetical protein D3C79_674240 [compost metagenome]